MKRWYVLYTKPNAEYQVAATLQQRGIQTYLPEIYLEKTTGKCKPKPFFPCYLFIQIDFDIISFASLQWTPGLRYLVTCNKCPVSVSETIITIMHNQLDNIKTSGGWPTHHFRPGDTVRIADGPFEDMLAVFEGPTTPSQRVHVLLTILGHANRLQLDVANLKKENSDHTVAPAKRPRRTRGRGRYTNRSATTCRG